MPPGPGRSSLPLGWLVPATVRGHHPSGITVSPAATAPSVRCDPGLQVPRSSGFDRRFVAVPAGRVPDCEMRSVAAAREIRLATLEEGLDGRLVVGVLLADAIERQPPWSASAEHSSSQASSVFFVYRMAVRCPVASRSTMSSVRPSSASRATTG